MRAAQAFSFVGGSSSYLQSRKSFEKSLAGKGARFTEHDVMADLVKRALKKSFPDETSEDAIAEAARDFFRNKRGEPVSARTIRYWLDGETLPSAIHLATLIQMQPKVFLSVWLGYS